MRKRERLIALTGTILIILFLSLTEKYFYRFDITENKLFTLTPVSRSIFREIPQPVIIHYYVSDNLEQIMPDIRDIKNMLQEFKVFSHGKIQLVITHPEGKDADKEMEKAGIMPLTVKVVKNNEETTLRVYSGIKIQFLDRTKVLPGVFTSDNLEYQIVSNIREIIQNRRRVVGLLLGNADKKLDSDYSLMRDNLSNDFDLKIIDRGSTEISAINVLVVIGSRDLSKADIDRIDHFIDKGGNVLFAVDGVYVDLEKNLKAVPLENDLLIQYLRKYGVRIAAGIVLDPFSKKFRIPKEIYGNIAWQTVGAYPEWVSVQKSSVSEESPVTANFTGLDLLWTSPLIMDKRKDNDSMILAKSSTLAWEMNTDFRTSPYSAGEYGPGTGKQHGQFNLAVSLSHNKARLIVVGDSDFLSNLIQYSESYYNLGFIHNCIDWLSQNDDFMRIRTRHDRDVYLDAYPDNRRAWVYFASKVINVFVLPLLILVVAFIQFRKESRKK